MANGLVVLYCDEEAFKKISEDSDLSFSRRFKGFDMFFVKVDPKEVDIYEKF